MPQASIETKQGREEGFWGGRLATQSVGGRERERVTRACPHERGGHGLKDRQGHDGRKCNPPR